MKTNSTRFLLLGISLLLSSLGKAQQDWPKIITGPDGLVIKMYQPEPESYSANILKFRSAISVVESGSSEPVFGTFWSTCKLAPEGNSRIAAIESVNITAIKIPAITDQHDIDFIKSTLEYQIPQVATQVSLNEIEAALGRNQQEAKLANSINNKAPKVIFTTTPSMLVFIDGSPKLQRNTEWGADVVVNSPYTIIKNDDNQFYLYGGHHWYKAPDATGPYQYTYSVPSNLFNIETILNKDNAANDNGQHGGTDSPVPSIIVSTTPAELIQSKGEPNFSPISGTGLLYISNSVNDIFMDLNSQMYYVLISGRWYKSKALGSNQWEFIGSDKLPADFARIPEGSPKDNVLASVAGTEESKEALLNAQVPQTAKVDRRTANTNVNYNGDPIFEPINGTKLQYAVNTSSTVLRYKGLYYTVDNGVWFVSGDPSGPWAVATERPEDVDLIPPSNPAYNSKYVYVYDEDPDYVYTGYTPGYLNSYVYGPTVVYGTGYYYDPWWGDYYYPRPWSWGFNIGYNPWYGWGFGFSFGWGGWFNYGYGYPGYGYGWGGSCGGWWGPAIYHPPYCGGYGAYHPYGGYYGQNGTINRSNYYSSANVRNSTNTLYRGRTGVSGTRNSFGYANSSGRQFNRSTSSFRNPQYASQTSTLSNRRAFNNYGSQNALNRNGSRSYNNMFNTGRSNNNQGNARAFPNGNDQRANMMRSFDRSSQTPGRNAQRMQSYNTPQRSFGGSGNAAPRSLGGGGGGSVGRSFGSAGSGGARSFSSGGGGGRSFGGSGGGGGRSFSGGGGGGRSSSGGGGGGGGGRAGRR